jgi:hypothetical protein
MSAETNAAPDSSAIAQMAIKLAETQLLAQIADDASLDGRATGLLAFNGAIVAATIAAKSLLGEFWWTPLIVVALTTWILLFKVLYPPVGLERKQLKRDQEDQERRWQERPRNEAGEYEEEEVEEEQEEQQQPASLAKTLWRTLVRAPSAPDVALPARRFYETYGGETTRQARLRLVAHLGNAFAINGYRIAYRRRWLRTATLTLVAGFGIASLLIASDLPSKLSACPKSQSRCHSLPSGRHTWTPPVGPSGKADGELVALALTIEAGHHGGLVEIAESIERS